MQIKFRYMKKNRPANNNTEGRRNIKQDNYAGYQLTKEKGLWIISCLIIIPIKEDSHTN